METKKHIFTPMEKKCLEDIVKKYTKIIENKNTDGSTLRIKNKAWDKITQEFNASSLATNQASHKQLRRLWINLRQRQREALIKKRQHRLATRKGPSTSDASVERPMRVGIDTVINSDTIQELKGPTLVTLQDRKSILLDQAIVITSDPLGIVTESEETERENPTPQKSTAPSTSSRPTSHTQMPVQCAKITTIEKEYKDRQQRANEKHAIEMQILKEQLREARAKADLAELTLKHKRTSHDET